VKVKFKTYSLFGATGVLLLPAAALSQEPLLDIHMHDTYLVLSVAQVLISIAILFFTLYCLYYFGGDVLLSTKVIRAHINFTMLSVTTLLALIYFACQAYNPGYSDWSFFEKNNTLILLNLLLLLLGQLILIIYFIKKMISTNVR
jgi:hypothetical protein